MIFTVAAIAVAYLYLAAVAHRVGHSGKHGQRIWSTPRPTRLRSRGAHTKPPAKAVDVAEPEQAGPAGLAVAA
ncbi:hypothetical protein [Actinomadura bangladeshensis]|uniref:Uncharacterized protein n=1 Tax=Actinomadura bangladeshensis TaxID=453573 RepID=A0A6L9QB85_9ACTN|nr:hypothetical protein [Actinomadura bangladeshensis]NEA21545.1 hypothetical protein [Actinomadura bangladeshensis]NEA22505.1 hypothetical protein [Actinomadura bangladeshensis]